MKKIIMNSKAKILVGVLVVGLIVIGSVLIIAEHTGNLTQHEAVSEDILPIYLRATPYELSSNELKVGKPFNLTIELKTANINARVLDGNYTGKLILIGENVSIVSKVLWEGKIKKNIDEIFVVTIKPYNKHSSLKILFSITDYRDIELWIIKKLPEAKPTDIIKGY